MANDCETLFADELLTVVQLKDDGVARLAREVSVDPEGISCLAFFKGAHVFIVAPEDVQVGPIQEIPFKTVDQLIEHAKEDLLEAHRLKVPYLVLHALAAGGATCCVPNFLTGGWKEISSRDK